MPRDKHPLLPANPCVRAARALLLGDGLGCGLESGASLIVTGPLNSWRRGLTSASGNVSVGQAWQREPSSTGYDQRRLEC
jgi:hypothetical protein